MTLNSSFRLDGKHILVTGASSGIGLSICRAIIDAGGRVTGTARRQQQLSEMVRASGEGKASSIQADLADDTGIKKIASEVEEVDGVVYAAGVSKLTPLKFVKRQDLTEVMNINYFAMVLLLSQLLKNKKIKKNNDSSIVLISSVAQQIGTKSSLIYTGSKGAMSSAARVIANELAPQRIRVNTIEPGMVRTDMTAEMENILSTETIEKDRLKYPLGYGAPEDVANGAIFLLSDASRWMTGRSLTMDGGRYSLLD
ncbi:MAG: SDR family oxidoreductase [Chitinophagaceae bacterium]|nr:SDR family oxidoreductase [Chitinophagaceae bacterium]